MCLVLFLVWLILMSLSTSSAWFGELSMENFQTWKIEKWWHIWNILKSQKKTPRLQDCASRKLQPETSLAGRLRFRRFCVSILRHLSFEFTKCCTKKNCPKSQWACMIHSCETMAGNFKSNSTKHQYWIIYIYIINNIYIYTLIIYIYTLILNIWIYFKTKRIGSALENAFGHGANSKRRKHCGTVAGEPGGTARKSKVAFTYESPTGKWESMRKWHLHWTEILVEFELKEFLPKPL